MTPPLLGKCSPDASLSSVDLPQPDGPTTATNSPALTEIVSASTASVPPVELPRAP